MRRTGASSNVGSSSPRHSAGTTFWLEVEEYKEAGRSDIVSGDISMVCEMSVSSKADEAGVNTLWTTEEVNWCDGEGERVGVVDVVTEEELALVGERREVGATRVGVTLITDGGVLSKKLC